MDEQTPAEPGELKRFSLSHDAINDDETNVSMAIRFWKHSSLKDIPIDQKRQYLREKGVTDAQIHKAWDRIIEEDTLIPLNNSQSMTATSPPQPTYLPPQYSAPSTHPHTSQVSGHPSPDLHYMPYAPTPRFEEEEGPGPFLQGVSLVALGGFVGLTAAAAVRWLNGGDFQFLPPPCLPDDSIKQRSIVLQGQQADTRKEDYDDFIDTVEEEYATYDDEEENNNNDDDDGEENGLIPYAQEKLLDQVQSISESMKAHVTIQEKILQKLSSQGTSITNHSMELLRKSSGITSSDDSSKSTELLKIWAQLLDIKCELLHLRDVKRESSVSCGDLDSIGNQLGTTLSKLDSCLESIQESFICQPSPKSLKADNAAPITIPPSIPMETPDTHLKEKAVFHDDDSPHHFLTLRQAVRRMAKENDATTLRVGSQLLYLYIVNLTGAPTNPRYRKIFTTNESFQKVESMIGGKDLLLAVGFEEGKGYLEWLASNPSPEAEGLAMTKLQEATAALGILKSGQPSADLTDRAMAVLSPDPDVHLVAPVPPPSTPNPSVLVSPPPPKKMPFVHRANDSKMEENE